MRKFVYTVLMVLIITTSAFSFNLSDFANKINTIQKYIPKTTQAHKHSNLTTHHAIEYDKSFVNKVHAIGFYPFVEEAKKYEKTHTITLNDFSNIEHVCQSCHDYRRVSYKKRNYLIHKYVPLIKQKRQEMLDKYGYVDLSKIPKTTDLITCKDVDEYLTKVYNPFIGEPFKIEYIYFTISKDVDDFTDSLAKAVSTKCLDSAIYYYNFKNKKYPVTFTDSEKKQLQKIVFNVVKETYKFYVTKVVHKMRTPLYAIKEFAPTRDTVGKWYRIHEQLLFKNRFYAYRWYFENYISFWRNNFFCNSINSIR